MKDPAFLFYPGDAAEDVSHMNRLERGAYFDFVQAQKKFGPLNLTMVQKILGKDFESVWDSLKMCLTYENDMYYITWLQDSIIKRKKYSESRADNRKGQNKAKNKENELTYVRHMENGNGNRNEIVNELNKEPEHFEDRWQAAFDERTLGDIKSTYRFLDLQKELAHYRLKCDADKSDYHKRDSEGLRKGFLYQLKNEEVKTTSKQKPNAYKKGQFVQ